MCVVNSESSLGGLRAILGGCRVCHSTAIAGRLICRASCAVGSTPICGDSSMSSHLRGKPLFISGASRGIGLAIALRAARDGANVAIAAKTDQPHPRLPGTIHTAAAQVVAAGGQALALVCDIRDEQQVEAAVAASVARFRGIDVCLNHASAISLTPLLDTPLQRLDPIHRVLSRGS